MTIFIQAFIYENEEKTSNITNIKYSHVYFCSPPKRVPIKMTNATQISQSPQTLLLKNCNRSPS